VGGGFSEKRPAGLGGIVLCFIRFLGGGLTGGGGGKYSLTDIIILSCFFNVTIDYLLGGSPDPTPPSSLSTQEHELLSRYRHSNARGKGIITGMADAVAASPDYQLHNGNIVPFDFRRGSSRAYFFAKLLD